MTAVVKTIRDGIGTRIETVLPTWTELDHKYDLLKNDFTNQSIRYGVIAQDGPAGISIMKHYTVSRSFDIILVQGFRKTQRNNAAQQAAVDILENAVDEILVDLINTKGGSPANVLTITLENISPPDFGIENVTSQILTITIQYKRNLTT